MHRFSDIPQRGDVTTYDEWDFIVEAADERRVLSIRAIQRVSGHSLDAPTDLAALTETAQPITSSEPNR